MVCCKKCINPLPSGFFLCPELYLYGKHAGCYVIEFF
nr:MAG TPA: hypothetical protein [Bacteriophage sp.]